MLSLLPDGLDFKGRYLDGIEGWINPGLSLIVDPDGKIVAGPLDGEEGILYADVESHQLIGPRWQLDVAGHYARPDIFQLKVRRESRRMLDVEVEPDSTDEPAESS